MRVEGSIRPIGDRSRVNCKSWCELVALRPEFRRPEPHHGINPFNGGPMIRQPSPDVASVVVDGVSVGKVYWSMDEEEPLINVSIEREYLPLVLQWATELSGEFGEDMLPEDGDA